MPRRHRHPLGATRTTLRGHVLVHVQHVAPAPERAHGGHGVFPVSDARGGPHRSTRRVSAAGRPAGPRPDVPGPRRTTPTRRVCGPSTGAATRRDAVAGTRCTAASPRAARCICSSSTTVRRRFSGRTAGAAGPVLFVPGGLQHVIPLSGPGRDRHETRAHVVDHSGVQAEKPGILLRPGPWSVCSFSPAPRVSSRPTRNSTRRSW